MFNYLNATIINTFLAGLNNPALPEKGFHEVFLDITQNQAQDPTVQESIKQLGYVWSEAYVEDILNRNTRSIPFTTQDIKEADEAGIDILVFKSYTEVKMQKAKKGTAEYDEWLRKYREKKGKKQVEDDVKDQKMNPNTLKARKALAGISTVTRESVEEAMKGMSFGIKPKVINGVHVTIHADEEQTMFMTHSANPSRNSTDTAVTFMVPFDKLTKKDYGTVAVAINKIVNDKADYYIPKPDPERQD